MCVRTAGDIAQLGTILFIAAHPDDESFIAAGLLATAVQNGQAVVCVTATRGEAGSQDTAKWPPSTLGAVREHELTTALHELGIHDHVQWNYPDGGCSGVALDEAVVRLGAVIAEYRPDTILTFGPEGMTGHPDHQAVSRWTDMAVADMKQRPHIYHAVCTPEQYKRSLQAMDEKLDIYFNIKQPPLIPAAKCAIAYELSATICRQKCKALAAMPSQTELLFRYFSSDFVRQAFASEYFVDASFNRK